MANGCLLFELLVAALLQPWSALGFEVTLGQNSKCSWDFQVAGLEGIKKDLETSIRAEVSKELVEIKHQLDEYKPLLQLIRRPNDTQMLTTAGPEDKATPVPTVATLSKSCPVGYIQYADSCYDIKMTRLNWYKARSYCKRQGAELVSINSMSEQRFLTERLEKYYSGGDFWTGMIYDARNQKKWSDGTDVSYTTWGIAEKSCFSQGCRIYMSSEMAFSWEFVEGRKKMNYICETSPKPQRKAVLKSPRCPEGFTNSMDHCYKFGTKKETWAHAREVCQRYGADLVSINSRVEQSFLERVMKRDYPVSKYDYFWTGLLYLPEHYLWVDGTVLNYSNWGKREPNCMESSCKALLSEPMSYKWEDVTDVNHYKYICELALEY